MTVVQETGFFGANYKVEPRFLTGGVGRDCLNQKPNERGDFRPWRVPLAVSGPPNVPSDRVTIYRLGRASSDETLYWLSWTTTVHVVRDFDPTDTTERTAFTGSGSPKWTNNIIGVASAPYPTATRELQVPPPLVAPTVVLNTDGPSGTARQLYYVYTRVNDIGWESAPSPPTLGAAAKPGAIFDLSYSESVPAGNYGVTKVRWYRQQVAAGTTVAEYFFLREYAIGAGGQQDDGRALGEQLPTDSPGPWVALSANAHSLTSCWNGFAAAVDGNAVRFCVPNTIYAWPLEYEYTLNDKPLTLASFAQRLIAFTSGGVELFTGDHPERMDQKPTQAAVLVSVRSVVAGEKFCMWAAKDGLWYAGVDGTRCLTSGFMTAEQWAALIPSTIHGHLLQLGERTLYVGFYNDGALKGFVVDLNNPNGFFPLATGYTVAYWDPLLRKLYVLEGSVLKSWDAGGSYMTGTWTGKIARQEEHQEAEWLELLSSGSVTMKVFTEPAGNTDDAVALTQRMSRTVARGLHRIPNGTTGRDWQVQFSTQGSVQGVSVE